VYAEHEAFLHDTVEACRRHYGDRLVSLAVFGSIGRGTPRRDSDV
jgi:predicted nucleotidyltransferase